MDTARGFFSKVASGTGFGYDDSAVGNGNGNGMMQEKNRFGMGIGNTPTGVKSMSMSANVTPGYLGRWGEDRFTNIAIGVRVAQLILIFCMLIVDIVLATFQNKWIGAISGLTGLLLVVTVFTFLFVIFLVGMSFAPNSLQTTVDRIERIFEQPRLALVMNGTGLLVWTIISITQTASALSSKACKDPAQDPHAKSSKGNNADFVKQLPTFCSTKKAGAAFCWLIFLTCVSTTLLFLRYWRLSRKNGPRIPPFVHPADEGDFEPVAGDVDGDAYDREPYGQQDNQYNAQMSQYGQGGDGQYAPPQLRGYSSERARYDPEAAAGYGRTDPFSNTAQIPRQSYDYGAYSSTPIPDPYSAIQAQLSTGAPPQMPPLYRGGS